MKHQPHTRPNIKIARIKNSKTTQYKDYAETQEWLFVEQVILEIYNLLEKFGCLDTFEYIRFCKRNTTSVFLKSDILNIKERNQLEGCEELDVANHRFSNGMFSCKFINFSIVQHPIEGVCAFTNVIIERCLPTIIKYGLNGELVLSSDFTNNTNHRCKYLRFYKWPNNEISVFSIDHSPFNHGAEFHRPNSQKLVNPAWEWLREQSNNFHGFNDVVHYKVKPKELVSWFMGMPKIPFKFTDLVMSSVFGRSLPFDGKNHEDLFGGTVWRIVRIQITNDLEMSLGELFKLQVLPTNHAS